MTDCHITVQRGGTHGAQRHIFQSAAGQAGKTPGGGAGRICPGPLCPGLGQPDHPWGGDSPGQLLHVFRRQRGTVPLSDGRLRHAAHPPDGAPAGRTERSGIRRVSGPVRLRTGPPGGIPGSAEHPPAQRRYAPRPVPGRMPGGPAGGPAGADGPRAAGPAGGGRPGSHPPPALFPHRRRPDALGRPSSSRRKRNADGSGAWWRYWSSRRSSPFCCCG